MKGVITYKLINGELFLNNHQIKLIYNTKKYYKDIKKIIALIVFILTLKKKIVNFSFSNGWYETAKTVLLGIAVIIIILTILEYVFKRVWSAEIAINDIIKIEIENDGDEKEIDDDSKIEITLIKSNGRKKMIELQKQNNQLNPFLEEIKKRNTRIKIENKL